MHCTCTKQDGEPFTSANIPWLTTAAVVVLAVGIIVALGGVLGILGSYNLFPQSLAWMGSMSARGLEYAIMSICIGGAVACAGGWLAHNKPWNGRC